MQHIRTDSPLALLHPYSRTYCAVLLCIAAASASTLPRLMVVAVMVVTLAAVARVRPYKWLLGVLPVVSLAVWLVGLSVVSGMPLGETDFPAVALFVLRCYLTFLAASALFTITGHRDIIGALDYIRIPGILTAVAGQIIRWFDVVLEESRKMNTSRLLRGGDRKSRFARLGDLARLASSMMVRSFFRAHRAAAAMDCRGFNGRLPRSMQAKVRMLDLAPSLLLACSLVLVWVLL